ncbi:MAG TPA: IS1380 family transposase [Streptosporangiaceae bacterium]|nr:IS1380 family transposase [Streptosporangiaceae bacterium]
MERTRMVQAAAGRAKTRGKIQIGAADPSLTGAGGMLAVTELAGKLGLIGALDAGIGPVKQRARGFTGGQVLAGMAAAQLAGEDFLVGLDRVRADQAGQQITLVPGLATSTATGIARRFTAEHWRGAEAGLAKVTARMVAMLPAERAAELAEGPVTIDIDATDVEVYGTRKRGVAYNYAGQRAGRPHVASWAETEIPLAADLLAGDQDPRSSAVDLLGRALAALPQQVRGGARAAGRKIALRADAGYFAGDLARAAVKEDMAFAIGAKRISSMWRALAGIAEDAWRDATGMDGAQVAVSPYKPAEWPEGTVLLIRRVKLDPEQVSADPRSRRRRTLHPDQRALPFPELEQEPAIYAYSFICTNMDVSSPAKAAAAEHWYRHRTSCENIFRDSKHGAALRHLPSGDEQVNTCWMHASLIAAAIAAWLHQLTGPIEGGDLLAGHGTRGGKAMIATLRRTLIAIPARLVRHGGKLIMRLPPGPWLLPQILAAIRALPAAP